MRALLISLCWWVAVPLCAASTPGRFDLTRWDQTKNLNLDGTWLHAPHQLLRPDDLESFLANPERFQTLSAGAAIDARIGTYVLRLANPHNLTELALFHGYYFSSARSFIFCRNQPARPVTLDLGRVGTDAASSVPKLSTFAIQDLQPLASIIPCTELVIMLQVSSFHHASSGMWMPPRLGRTADFRLFLSQQERSYAFILGILLFVSFYAASFAVRRPDEKTAVYVAMGAFILGLRIAFLFYAEQTDEGSSPWLWHFENFCIYAASYLVPYLSLKSLNAFTPGTIGKRWERGLDIYAGAALAIQLFLPVRIWTPIAGLFLIFGVGCVLAVIYFLLRALLRGQRKTLPHLLGVLFAFSGMVMEILVVYRVIDYLPLNISGYGSALWISLQLQLAAQRFADALENSEYLSKHLQDEVQKQTEQLRDMNRYIAENVLRRFLPPTVVADIVAGKRALDEKARALHITVLFADLCDFTQVSSSLGPERTAAVLNSFLVQMTEAVFEVNGTIDKFLGDGVLVLFGAPEVMEPRQQAEAAWRCATRMQEALSRLNALWQEQGWPVLRMRIGMHCGSAVVGSFGGPMRSDYTAIGDTVNLASRIQSAAEPDRILISEELAGHLPAAVVIGQGFFQLKGIAEARPLYRLQPWNPELTTPEKKSA